MDKTTLERSLDLDREIKSVKAELSTLQKYTSGQEDSITRWYICPGGTKEYRSFLIREDEAIVLTTLMEKRLSDKLKALEEEFESL